MLPRSDRSVFSAPGSGSAARGASHGVSCGGAERSGAEAGAATGAVSVNELSAALRRATLAVPPMVDAMPLTYTRRHGTTYLRVMRQADQADGQ